MKSPVQDQLLAAFKPGEELTHAEMAKRSKLEGQRLNYTVHSAKKAGRLTKIGDLYSLAEPPPKVASAGKPGRKPAKKPSRTPLGRAIRTRRRARVQTPAPAPAVVPALTHDRCLTLIEDGRARTFTRDETLAIADLVFAHFEPD